MIKTLRTLILALVALAIINHTAFAGDAATTAKTVATDFRAGEFNLDAGYLARTEDVSTFDGSTYLGLQYYVTKGAGLHVGLTGADSLEGPAVKTFEFGVVGRIPIRNVALEFGTGAEFAIRPDDWAVYAEAGPRVRVWKQIDVFAKVRGTRPVAGAEHESIALIAGGGTAF